MSQMAQRISRHLSVLIDRTALVSAPFEFVTLDGVFPDEVYNELLRLLPENSYYRELKHSDAILANGQSASSIPVATRQYYATAGQPARVLGRGHRWRVVGAGSGCMATQVPDHAGAGVAQTHGRPGTVRGRAIVRTRSWPCRNPGVHAREFELTRKGRPARRACAWRACRPRPAWPKARALLW